ncbi:MAG TPA: class I SAM-dependent methyltransferase [Gemmatimonadaceae bacterium]|nr:class I SAM-dependent methyltransferase [Gemmatimonadaceae bacterium]
MPTDRTSELSASYDEVAEEYVRRIAGELEHKPFDRELLDRFAAMIDANETVCDIGCGPAHVARHLLERGVKVIGIDLSPEMVEQARLLNPELDIRQGDMLSLDVPDESWAGIVAFYSIIHVPRASVPRALSELGRCLRPGGRLLMSFHIGDEVMHLEELWGHPVKMDFIFFRTDEMLGYLGEAGFDVEEALERDPYPDVEYPSRRAYILAFKRLRT